MALFSHQPGDEGLPGHERLLAMIAVMVTTTMAVFDGSMVNIALPEMATALHVSAGAAVWITNGYLLSAAMMLTIFSALAARVGFRRLFVFGLALFTLSSLGCALSSTLDMLVTMRILQGIGGAATLSIAPAILRSIFPTRLLGRILGINALLIATSTAVAPLLGGTVLSTLSWQWLFALNVPLGIVAIVLSLHVLHDTSRRLKKSFDFVGALLSALVPGSLIMATNAIATPAGYEQLAAIGYGTIAICTGILFFWRQRRAPEPLLPPEMFASSRFSLAALTSCASFVSQGITFVALPFLFQNVYGYSVLAAALLFTPWPVGIMLAAPHAGRLADRYAPAMISTAGLAIFATGLILLALLPAHAHSGDIALRSLICGLGFGCFQSPNNREMLANVSRENSGYASGILAMMRTFGQCLGAACVGVILSFCLHSSKGLLQEAQAVRISLWLAAAATLLAIIFSGLRSPRSVQKSV